MKLNEAIKLRLEHYLSERKITTYKFLKDSGIPRSTITNLSSGHTKSPTVATIYQIVDGLGISILDFFDCDLLRETNIIVD